MSMPRPRQPPTTTRARVHTRARASMHTNADSMSATLNCACRQKLSAATSSILTTGVTSCRQQATPRRVASANLFVHCPIRRRNTGTAHAPAAADSDVVADTNTEDAASSASGKCVGAATEVTVVVRVRVGVVDVVVVDVDGVDDASVVVVAAVTAAGMPPAGVRRQHHVPVIAVGVSAMILTAKMQQHGHQSR